MNLLASFNGTYSLAGLEEFVVVVGAWSLAAVLVLVALGFAFVPTRRRSAGIACVAAGILTAVCVHRQWQAGPAHFDTGNRILGAAPAGLAVLILIVLYFLPGRARPPVVKLPPERRD